MKNKSVFTKQRPYTHTLLLTTSLFPLLHTMFNEQNCYCTIPCTTRKMQLVVTILNIYILNFSLKMVYFNLEKSFFLNDNNNQTVMQPSRIGILLWYWAASVVRVNYKNWSNWGGRGGDRYPFILYEFFSIPLQICLTLWSSNGESKCLHLFRLISVPLNCYSDSSTAAIPTLKGVFVIYTIKLRNSKYTLRYLSNSSAVLRWI